MKEITTLEELRAAVTRVVEYDLPTERADYEECVKLGDLDPEDAEGHIYVTLSALEEWASKPSAFTLPNDWEPGEVTA